MKTSYSIGGTAPKDGWYWVKRLSTDQWECEKSFEGFFWGEETKWQGPLPEPIDNTNIDI